MTPVENARSIWNDYVQLPRGIVLHENAIFIGTMTALLALVLHAALADVATAIREARR